ncbi:MAG: hypothetical protein HC802_23720 [Caldilineaceae bacterium]|nr:hypothetical protein [Caldilineaceae bacterium]
MRGQDFIPEIRLELEQNPPGSSSITRKIDEVYQRLNIAKQRRYHQILREEDGWQDAFVERNANVIYPAGDGQEVGGACRSCRKLPVDRYVSSRYGRNSCRRCNEDFELGRFLIRTTLVAYRRGEAATSENAFDLAFFPRNQRYTVRLAATPELLEAFAPLHVEYLAIDRACFEDEDAYNERQTLATTTSHRHPTRRRYLANYVPREGNEIVSFSDLAERCGRLEQQGEVEPLLGIVKMDVDQLGLLVSEGLGKATSIARMATFSRMVDLFFSGWVDTKLRRLTLASEQSRQRRDSVEQAAANPFRDIYTVYAGGDDLMLVGPWDIAVRAAYELQADFQRFTNHNPNLTVSTSVVVIKPRYPVARAAQQASKLLEEHAKQAGRNRLHLFGITVPWYERTPAKSDDAGENQLRQNLGDRTVVTSDPPQPVEAAMLWHWAEFFDDALYKYRQSRQRGSESYPVSNILLHRLLRLSLASQRIAAAGAGTIDDLTYMAHLAYFLGRSIDAKKHPDLLQKLMSLTLFNQVQLMAHLQMPLTWALYRNRQRS